GADLSELVIFPVSQNESRGIEDLRLVQFTDDGGTTTLCGTYTAFNGHTIFPTMLIVNGNGSIQSHTMSGRHARNKGMALFPRKINGRFVMSGRLDGENLYILESDNPLVWNEGRLSLEPKYWWQFSVIGNCGSPIETPEGWILLTHGVGPMRQYSIGAVLLDLEDPARVIGELTEPLISPTEDERIGYVPNVVYTCGALLHNGSLIIPYAVSDVITKFAKVNIDELLSELRLHG
ncbi:MAG TPA: glycosidase, partial [Armatimonadota bacterium]|nr:glycosidase [Armatimonadota bacterium]